MEEINIRLAKAQGMSRERQAAALSRVREHNTLEIQAAQEKAARSLEQQISEFSNKIAGKLEGAENNKEKHDRSVEKKQEEKHKAFSEKLRNYHNNIRHLQDEESSKLEELSKKFVSLLSFRIKIFNPSSHGRTKRARYITGNSSPTTRSWSKKR